MSREDLVGVYHDGVIWDDDSRDAVKLAVPVAGVIVEVWLPRSQIHEYDESMVILPRWLSDDRNFDPDWEELCE